MGDAAGRSLDFLAPWARRWSPGEWGRWQGTCAGDSSLSSSKPVLPLRVRLGYPTCFSVGDSEAGSCPLLLVHTALTCPLQAPFLPNFTCLSRLPMGTEAAQCREEEQNWESGCMGSWKGNSLLTEVYPQSQRAPKLFLFRFKMSQSVVGYLPPPQTKAD